MLGLTITLAPAGTKRSMPPNAAIARRTIASGSPDRATTRSGEVAGVEVGSGMLVACDVAGCASLAVGFVVGTAACAAEVGIAVACSARAAGVGDTGRASFAPQAV